MTFPEAYALLLEVDHIRVKRANWRACIRWPEDWNNPPARIKMFWPSGHSHVWQPLQEDITAGDWIVVERAPVNLSKAKIEIAFDLVGQDDQNPGTARRSDSSSETRERISMNKQERDELRSVALAATSGTWEECGHERGGCPCCLVWAISADTTIAGTNAGSAKRVGFAYHAGNDTDGDLPMVSEEQGKTNARFIARANPTTVLALLDEIDRLEGKE
jgi:hypothetical protein